MHPLFMAALGSLLRTALAGAAGYLVSRGIWTDAEAGPTSRPPWPVCSRWAGACGRSTPDASGS